MNKDQFARLERHRKVKQRLTDFKSVVDSVPAFADLATTYVAQLTLLEGTARRKPVTSQGATTSNETAGDALIERLVKAANALWLLYKAEGNLTQAAKLHRRPTDYREMQYLELATEAISLSKQVQARQATLTNYNINAAAAQALAADAQAFDAALENPQLAIDEQKIKGATAKSTLSDLNRYLRDDLRAGMELIKDSHPDAYQALREACQVDDPAYRKRKAQRMMKREVQGGSSGTSS